MSTSISRTQFLRGDFSGRNTPIRPPWAVEEFLFTSICNACGDCIEKCPTQIIKAGRGNYPVIDFDRGECLFCGDCADLCKPKALNKTDNHTPWQIIAHINTTSCIAYHGTECRSCYDPCEARAINMMPRIGGVSIPVMDENICTGCGACHAICPADSINMQSIKIQRLSEENQ